MNSPEEKDEANRRFRLGCRLLRNSGLMAMPLPGQRSGESWIDWLTRHRVAADPYAAVEMLLAGNRLTSLRDQLLQLPELKDF